MPGGVSLGDVEGGADVHQGAPRLAIVRASASGTADSPRLEILFTSSVFPGRDFRARFSDVPYGGGSFSEATPADVCTAVKVALLEEVETGGPARYVVDEAGTFVCEY